MAKQKRLKIALIGYGAISQMLFDVFREKKPPIDIVGVLVRKGRVADTQKKVGKKVAVVDTLKALLKLNPDVVVEAASQQAVREWGETILKKGFDFMVIATGAYGDPVLWKKHLKAAEKGGSRLRLPSGAIAGLDGLLAMRLGKLEKVKYISIKPPHAWTGTPAETEFDLPSIKEPTVIFRGKPADAGRLYPKNANLAVTVALCGAGLDNTEIELVADPTLPPGTNASKLEVVADSGELKLERLGRAMPDNPKTGVLTALTMADDLLKIVRHSDW
ncbi:aspartate dehydrogenase [Reyranella sp. MMS21-HV4-11]|jgi:aspartate dehydrogenase|uniref:L-aspartate dehydrogenase n=1 Tax=Reyranella humidisoli TaxID=2849149 RepID=A0ABS6IND9_9HYPH|nr:aspartate dehydrogenase [Reyranella sp. MMS21-HV4-11]MBU8875818.1 aspartate dehydrogenase [Reyranella sp. MMS21-HV4-11]